MSEEFQFPREIKSFIDGLGDPQRYRILEALINNDKDEGNTLKELEILTGYNATTLHKQLHHLSAHSLVERFETLQNIVNNTGVGHYKISFVGTKLINALMSVLEVPPQE